VTGGDRTIGRHTQRPVPTERGFRQNDRRPQTAIVGDERLVQLKSGPVETDCGRWRPTTIGRPTQRPVNRKRQVPAEPRQNDRCDRQRPIPTERPLRSIAHSTARNLRSRSAIPLSLSERSLRGRPFPRSIVKYIHVYNK
jgi:hypothetical protein